MRPCSKCQCEKIVKLKGAARKWLWWYRLMAKILTAIIHVNLVLVKSGWGNMNWPELLLLKFLPSAYAIIAISWPPPLIYNFFHTGHFKQGCTFFTAKLFLNILFLSSQINQALKKVASWQIQGKDQEMTVMVVG